MLKGVGVGQEQVTFHAFSEGEDLLPLLIHQFLQGL